VDFGPVETFGTPGRTQTCSLLIRSLFISRSPLYTIWYRRSYHILDIVVLKKLLVASPVLKEDLSLNKESVVLSVRSSFLVQRSHIQPDRGTICLGQSAHIVPPNANTGKIVQPTIVRLRLKKLGCSARGSPNLRANTEESLSGGKSYSISAAFSGHTTTKAGGNHK